ncbi:MAG: S8 family serine peptidase [Geodermatophilaceae bacterium]
MRRTGTLFSAALVATGMLLIPVGSAHAAHPSCDTQTVDSGPIEPLPWAQRMYDPAERLWPFSQGAGIVVAVLDSGVDASHFQLQGKVLPGISLVPETPPEGNVDCVPFGTAVASIIAAEPVDGIGFAGLAPRATILPVRVSDKIHTNPGDEELAPGVLALGIDYAVANGADVVAVSAVSYRDDPALAEAVNRAVIAGVVVVAAVGDGHSESEMGLGLSRDTPYPAGYDGVIGVGSIGPDGVRSGTSQIGGYVDLVAPGLEVTAAAFGGHEPYNGTSIAVGFVAAAAALMLGQPDTDLAQLSGAQRVNVLTGRLYGTADGTVGGAPSLAYGKGLVDPYRAMTEAIGGSATALEGRRAPPPDEAALRLAAQRAAAQNSAVRSALVLGVVILVVLAAAFVIPRARRRRWSPSREREVRPGREDKRPEHLPGDMLFRAAPSDKKVEDASP